MPPAALTTINETQATTAATTADNMFDATAQRHVQTAGTTGLLATEPALPTRPHTNLASAFSPGPVELDGRTAGKAVAKSAGWPSTVALEQEHDALNRRYAALQAEVAALYVSFPASTPPQRSHARAGSAGRLDSPPVAPPACWYRH